MNADDECILPDCTHVPDAVIVVSHEDMQGFTWAMRIASRAVAAHLHQISEADIDQLEPYAEAANKFVTKMQSAFTP